MGSKILGNINDLSEEEKASLFGASQKAQDIIDRENKTYSFDTEGIAADLSRLADQDEGEIVRQDETAHFDGSTYIDEPVTEDEGLSSLFKSEEEKTTNDKIYELQGSPMIPGWESGPRTTKGVTKEGNPETKFVVPEALSDPVSRTVTGVGLGVAKSTAEMAATAAEAVDGRNWWNFAVGALPLSDELKKQLTIAKPDAVKYIKENFPTMPAASGMEQAAQEIGQIVFGAVGGAKVAKEAIEQLPKAKQMITEAAQSFFTEEMKKGDVINAQQKTEALIQSMLIEYLGANVGASAFTPDNTESLVGSMLGIEDTGFAGQFVDNTVFSGLLQGLGITVKHLAKYGQRVTGASGVKEMSMQGLAADLVRSIDPDLANTSPTEFTRRLAAFSRALSDNGTANFKNGTFGDLPLSPQQAMANGARQYVDEAYGYLRQALGPDYDAWAAQKAAQIADGIQSIKRENMGNPVVQAADALVATKGQQGLIGQQQALEGMMTPKEAMEKTVKTPLLMDYNAAKERVRGAQYDVAVKQDEVDALQDSNMFLDMVKRNRGGDAVSNALYSVDKNKEAAAKLQDEWQKSWSNYHDLYNNMPVGRKLTPQETESVAATIRHYSLQGDVNKWLGLDPAVAASTGFDSNAPRSMEQITADLQNMDLKTLVQQIPNLTNIVEAQKLPGVKKIDTTGYIDLIQTIKEIAKSEPSYAAAEKAFAEHSSKWNQIDATRYLNDQAAVTARSGEAAKEAGQTRKEFHDFVKNAVNAEDDSGETIKSLMATGAFDNKETSDLLMAGLMDKLAYGDVKNAQGLHSVIRNSIPKLMTVDKEAADLIYRALEDSNTAVSGLGEASTALTKATVDLASKKAQIAETISYRFIDDSAVGAKYAGEGADAKLNTIFGNADDTKKLMLEAKDTGNPLVLDGIQSQYLKKLTGEIFTNRPISATGENGEMAYELSLAKLNDLLDGKDKVGLAVIDSVFENKPKFKEDLMLLLTTLRDNASSRANRPQVHGSDTAINIARSNSRQQAASILTTIFFGRLNRTAATVGAVGKAFNTALSGDDLDKLRRFMPVLLTDTNMLSKTLDEIVKNPRRAVVDGIVDRFVEARYSGFEKGAVSAFIKPEEDEPDDTEKALGVK